jgi:hypothetical protein
MSLGKLLASGKSFVNGRSKTAYREDKRPYLPKFASKKNPFMPPPVQTELPTAEAKPLVAPRQKIAVNAPPANPGPTKSLAGWTRKFNPVTAWRESQESGRRAPRPVIQAELSLDRVKVVHNDLSDADVEVVPIKSRPAREMSEPILSSGENSWSRLGAKFFGANAI